ncbi:tetratricopeptide repeat protein, partial [Devosia sp.]|uniref:O-linked N-acetylglucosamine transferase, SPINDLY family protein n=1 Tax=Devosia sp. TaxID=1871048 RepID=UPI0035AE95A4
GKAEFHSNLAAVLVLEGDFVGAEVSAHRAIEIDPGRADALANLGTAQRRQGRPEDAVASYRRAAALRPDIASYRNNLGDLLLQLGRVEQAIPELRAVVAAAPDNLKARSDLIMTLCYSDAVGAAELLDEARRFGEVASRRAMAQRIGAAQPREEGAPFRIGFVSGDLRHHAVAQFIEGVLDGLLRFGHELHAYVTRDAADEVTARLLPRFAGWHPIFGLGNLEAARQIASDGIHILFDLSGHTGGNRLPLFAYRPAPVAASWIGYSGTTGLPEMDYLLADRHVLPVGDEGFYSERPVRLPHSYLLFNPPSRAPQVPPLPALANGFVTFGSFNNLSKLSGSTIAAWARLLQAVPDSRLVLKSPTLSSADARRLVDSRFAAHGIDPLRIDVLGRIASVQQHLAAYAAIDIALDPFPYAGTTTTCEALWMGRPVLSLKGTRFTARVGDSLLSTAGLADWVAADLEGYVAAGVARASDVSGLDRLSRRLREQVRASPLCATDRFAADLDAALRRMWDQRRPG